MEIGLWLRYVRPRTPWDISDNEEYDTYHDIKYRISFEHVRYLHDSIIDGVGQSQFFFRDAL
uniref:Uncharacterized protein n=1 Tax=Moniliophthora roreri TaxID=221103 RepID=A0A0W0GCG1_MONRR